MQLSQGIITFIYQQMEIHVAKCICWLIQSLLGLTQQLNKKGLCIFPEAMLSVVLWFTVHLDWIFV